MKVTPRYSRRATIALKTVLLFDFLSKTWYADAEEDRQRRTLTSLYYLPVSLALKRERVSGDEIQPHRWDDNCLAVIANVRLAFTFAPLRNRRTYRRRGETRC